MSKPRILLVTHFYATHRGGVELTAGRIARYLANRGYDITWAASDTDTVPDDMGTVKFLPMQASNAIEKKLGLPYPIWTTNAMSRLKKALEDVDLVHFHESVYHGNVVAARMARGRGLPYFVTQHVGFIPFKNPVLRSVLTAANKRLALPLLRKASAVIFISENTQKYFEELGLSHEASELIPNGVDDTLFRPNGPSDRKTFGFSKDRPLCLFVGRFVEKKGLPIVKQLAEANPEVQWAIAGWGPIDPAGWNLPNVKVLEGLTGPTLAPLYRAADLLVLPSVGEGFPAVVQEAMACGTASIVSTETAEGYAPAKPYVHTAPAADFEAWRQKLDSLLSDRTALQAKAPGLVEFAKEHWSWSTAIDRYEAAIARSIARKAA